MTILSCGNKTLGMEFNGLPKKLFRDFKTEIKKFIEDAVVKNHWSTAHRGMPVELLFVSVSEPPTHVPKWRKDATTLGIFPPMSKEDPWWELVDMFLFAMNGLVYEDKSQVFKVSYERQCGDGPRLKVIARAFFVDIGAVKTEISKQKKRGVLGAK